MCTDVFTHTHTSVCYFTFFVFRYRMASSIDNSVRTFPTFLMFIEIF